VTNKNPEDGSKNLLVYGHNNVQIKEEDEWKAAFTIHLGVYEPVVMYFGLTNLLATFQAMMNDILRDLIDKEEITVYINDILVGTNSEQGHEELVEKILRRMEENNLHIKPEECTWKTREIDFLGLVMGANRIKM